MAFLVEAVHVQGLRPDAPSLPPPGMGRFNLAGAEWESGPLSGTISFLHRTRPRFFAFKARVMR